MSLALPSFCTPLDGPLGTLIADRAVGGDLTLSNPARLGTPSRAAPVRLTVLAADGSAVLTQLIVVGVVANQAFCFVEPGFPDVACPTGSLLAVTASASALREIQHSITTTVSALNSLGAGSVGPAGPQGPVGPQGPIGLTGPEGPIGSQGEDGSIGEPGPSGPAGELGPIGDTGPQGVAGAVGQQGVKGDPGDSGLVSASSPLAYDPQAQALSLGALPATLLGTGIASTSTFLRGDNTWTAISAPPAGVSGNLQYNLGGAFAGTSQITTDGTNLVIGALGTPQATLDGGSFTTTGDSLTLAQTGDSFGLTKLEMLNRVGANGARFSCSLWLVDFIFNSIRNNVQSNIRFNTDGSILPANTAAGGGEFQFYMNTGGSSPQFAALVGAGEFLSNVPLVACPTVATGPSLTAQAAPGQTAPLVKVADSSGNALASFDVTGGFHPATLDDGAAGANCLYLSSTTGKLTYKDAAGTIHPLTS